MIASMLHLAVVLAGPALLFQEFQIQWDKNLAFENDRENYARLLQDHVEEASRSVAQTLGLTLKRLTIRVISKSEYEARFGRESAFSHGAHYVNSTIVVNGGNRLTTSFGALLEHEMIHAFLDSDGNGRRLPTWLNEGLAERQRWHRLGIESLATNQVAELKRALESNSLTPLPARGPISAFGYLQSFATILFLEERYGRDIPTKLARTVLEDGSYDQALRRVLKETTSGIESEFRGWVKALKSL